MYILWLVVEIIDKNMQQKNINVM